ncbi:MAG: glucosidase [Bacteroidia bacterium]|nr:glucosidase [Bacteroidia bacterium]
MQPTAEHIRLEAARTGAQPWKKWGPYLSDRQWGTVREDYSAGGNAWLHYPHDLARSKAWRWGEEGIGGISDDRQLLCFAPAFWNGRDSMLKERLFGLGNPDGNHGEDVKELYYYLDHTPSHAWMQMLYKYPQAAFPYEDLVRENRRRSKQQPEYEIWDTPVWQDKRYFDVWVEYAKAGPEDLLIRLRAVNHGPEAALLHLLPTLWFRNTWSWAPGRPRPLLEALAPDRVQISHPDLPPMALYAEQPVQWLFCENDSNTQRLYGQPAEGYFKDGINDHVVQGAAAVNPELRGTKCAAWIQAQVPAGGSVEYRFRLGPAGLAAPFAEADSLFGQRQAEADAFYAHLQRHIPDAELRTIQRQALAGMLWTKQFYYYDIPEWLEGDPAFPPPPAARKHGRNARWRHLNNADIISMPDKWEYPWYAAWDLAFHCIPLALVDPDFAKEQLLLLTREWYMHPNGQLPAYEWNFSDVNPPVHAWAAWKVYWIEQRLTGKPGDRAFLEEIYQKLLLNFTWWVNRKDTEGNNVFEGGFLGLDNIGVFDRSAELPAGTKLEQADGTSWMAMYSLNMMRIALELARENPVYESTATKFFEHFLYIAEALADLGGEGMSLWDEKDQFFYDVISMHGGHPVRLKVRSLVGLSPLYAVEVLDHELFEAAPQFTRRLEWFLEYRPDLASLVSRWAEMGKKHTHLLSLLRGRRMKQLLKRMLNEAEFLSSYGIRALSREHLAHPYTLHLGGQSFTVSYQPAESDSRMFGGNSNWRGPIWFPVNYLLIQSLRRFQRYYGEDFRVEHPAGSGQQRSLREIADDLARRLISIFQRDAQGRRPVFGEAALFQEDPQFQDHLLFYEYFHGDTGRGVGASHQTGWTGLVASLIHELHEPS